MAGEKNLDQLMNTLSAKLEDGVFVFLTIAQGHAPEGIPPQMMFREAEAATLIVLREEAEAHGLAYEYPCRMITLDVHSSLEAVGFIARIASALAARGISTNPVSGYYHDHLFVPLGREHDALQVLEHLGK